MLRRREAVVFGPYPPIPGPGSEATLGDVRRLLAEGADVRVISPERSAAHDDADLRRPAGALRFARRAVGADRLVLHLDGGLLTSQAHRGELPARLVVTAALRATRHGTVHVPGGVPLPAAWSRALAGADEIVAGDEGGPVVAETAAPEAPEPWSLSLAPTRQEVEAEIRRRAAERRAAQPEAGTGPAGHRIATRTIRALPLLDSEPTPSSRLPVEIVKRIVGRLTNWRINPLIERVNLLQRAVVEAVDRDAPPAGGASGG